MRYLSPITGVVPAVSRLPRSPASRTLLSGRLIVQPDASPGRPRQGGTTYRHPDRWSRWTSARPAADPKRSVGPRRSGRPRVRRWATVAATKNRLVLTAYTGQRESAASWVYTFTPTAGWDEGPRPLGPARQQRHRSSATNDRDDRMPICQADELPHPHHAVAQRRLERPALAKVKIADPPKFDASGPRHRAARGRPRTERASPTSSSTGSRHRSTTAPTPRCSTPTAGSRCR